MNTGKRIRAPYIGITDFMTRNKTQAMLSVFKKAVDRKIPHKLMVGVMMSYKTLHGIDTKWTTAFPKNEKVSSIFVNHEYAFNTLHYADYTNTDVLKSLTRAIKYGGENIDAIQLDMVWPNPLDISNAVRASKKNISVILQIGKDALTDVCDNPREAISRLIDYEDVIDGVLFDKSMSQGLPMDADLLLPFVEAVYTKIPTLRVAVTGGLGPTTVEKVESLIYSFPDISVDAQGKLRASGNALDPIDWPLATIYLQEMISLFQKHKK